MFEWLSAREPILIYAFLLLNSSLESLFPPYPSDTFILIVAFIAGQGHFSPYLVYVSSVVGSIGGIMALYYVGKSKGDAVIYFLSESFFGKIFPIRLIEKAKKKFAERGAVIILFNRFLPVMRAPICFAAGIVHINEKKIFSFSLVSVLLWNLFLVMVGFYVGSTWDEASKFLWNYNIIVTLMLFLVLIFSIVIYFRKKMRV